MLIQVHIFIAENRQYYQNIFQGIGFQTALDFAKRGARVILACRDQKKGEEACDEIIKATGNPNCLVKIINMESFESVRKFAKDIIANEKQLDILVNNAGALGLGNKKSIDGHDVLLQVNYFSSFLLTNLLIGRYTFYLHFKINTNAFCRPFKNHKI